jgi:hypothetical protein
MKKILILSLLFFILCGCSRHVIKYDIEDTSIKWDKKHILAIKDFRDLRPEEEKEGDTDEFLKFASKDEHFKKPITQSLDEVLKREFADVDIYVLDYEDDDPRACHYVLSGTIKHFQAAVKLPKTSVVPYLKTVTSIWSKDEFIIAIEIEITLIDNSSGKKILAETYSFTEGKKLPVGLFSLARYSRGFNYKLKLLDAALSDVIEDIRDDVIETIDKNYD